MAGGGAKPGERRGGRQKGTPNKVSVDLQKAALVYTPAALKTLNDICEKGESEAARVAAANALLDRGHGKPTQNVAHGGSVELQLRQLLDVIDGKTRGIPTVR